jgi:hypothetical protein
LYGYYTNGFDSRKTATGIPFSKFSETLKVNKGLSEDCTLENLSDKCEAGKEPLVLLWGDSHAAHLALGLKSSSTNIDFIQITMSSCRPVVGLAILGKITPKALDRTENWAKNCVENNDKVITWLTSKDSIEYVILASPFSFTPYVYYGGDVVKTVDDVVIKAFSKTINKIRKLGKKPIVISPVPNNVSDIGRCSVRALMLNKDAGICDFSISDFSEYTKSSYHTINLVKDFAPVFNLKDLICQNKQCDVIIDNIILYRDTSHLTKDGSVYIGKQYDLMGQIIKSADNYWK